MIWLDSIRPSPSLPTVWLIASGEQPRTRPERTLLRHRLSRQVLEAQAGKRSETIEITRDAAGRPVLLGVAGLHLSHATRAGFVAVALAQTPVGVDVEEVDSGPIPMGALHPEERQWLERTPDERRIPAFAQLWAAKEAYGKWAGLGLAEPDRFAILPNGGENWRFAATDVMPPPGLIRTRLVERNGVRLALAVAT